MANKLIKVAARQVLADKLGVDEGLIYYLLLRGKEREIEEEFSYSKKYRLMKSLFEKGALAKIKSEGKDFFTYFLLPPLFLVKGMIRNYLEKEYFENFGEKMKGGFYQMIMKISFEDFLKFLKKFGIEEIDFEFNKIKSPAGWEFFGYVEVLK